MRWPWLSLLKKSLWQQRAERKKNLRQENTQCELKFYRLNRPAINHRHTHMKYAFTFPFLLIYESEKRGKKHNSENCFFFPVNGKKIKGCYPYQFFGERVHTGLTRNNNSDGRWSKKCEHKSKKGLHISFLEIASGQPYM